MLLLLKVKFLQSNILQDKDEEQQVLTEDKLILFATEVKFDDRIKINNIFDIPGWVLTDNISL